ncbi:unnamed protein product [Gongylonema pulchrum]|uniref:Huntingtin n=1 Tax=Gongylonema pulchrum TaxID=637853 RepID=A0A183CXB9_9BILA|nr:unnamed protein product [Gongylonema pulchrum]
MEKYASNVHPRQWFLRRKKVFLEGLTKQLMFYNYEGLRPQKGGNFSDFSPEQFKNSIEYAISVIIELFDFPKNDIEGFMRIACAEIVTTLLLYCTTEKPQITLALDAIIQLCESDHESVMGEALPLLLAKQLIDDLSTEMMQRALEFIGEYSNGVCIWVCSLTIFRNFFDPS